MPEEQLMVTLRSDGAESILGVRGEIDMSTVPVLRARLDEAATQPQTTVVIDLSDVTFLDSSGLGALAVAHSSLAEDGRRLVIRGAHGAARRVLSVSGLSDTVDVE